MAELRIATDLALPLDAVTQAIAILARRGAGKTYTATVLVEEVIGAGAPVVVLDPTGAWWGLRTSADGKKAGLSVVILGGEHGDVALERTAGKEIADVVVEHPGAYIVDLSSFESNAAQDDFAADFLERLYRAKAKRRDALLLVVDEADSFAPQRPGPRQLRMLGSLEAIVRRGRIRGLGVVLISQRAAVLNKNVLTQCEALIALQTTGPQDRAAIDDWIKGSGTAEERDAVLGSLASLERGEAWVWSPVWLGTLQRVRIRARRTFDSSATPEAGAASITPTARATVDLEALGKRIAATREQAKANDPAELRRRIRELEAAAAKAPPSPAEVVVEKIVEVPVLNGQVKDLQAIAMSLIGVAEQIVGVGQSITTAIARVEAAGRPVAVASRPVAPVPTSRAATPTRPLAQLPEASGEAPGSLGKAERSILGALASYPIELTREQLAFLAGYHPRSSGYVNALGRLRSLGLVSAGFPAGLTDEGRAVAPTDAPPPGGVVESWLARFGKAERTILELLIAAHPSAIEREALADQAGYHPRSSGFVNALGKLRGLGLVDGLAISRGFAALLEVSR